LESSLQGKNVWDYMALKKILVEIKSAGFIPKVTITSRDTPEGSSLEKEFSGTYAAI
jgi:hypothetical protein